MKIMLPGAGDTNGAADFADSFHKPLPIGNIGADRNLVGMFFQAFFRTKMVYLAIRGIMFFS